MRTILNIGFLDLAHVMKKTSVVLVASLVSSLAYTDDAVYCPQKAGYVRVGMTQDQVIAACGQPQMRQKSNQPVMQKVPVQQLYFEHNGGPEAFYGVWKLPGGYPTSGGQETFSTNSGGQTLEIDVIFDKIAAIRLNGGSLNSLTTCDSPIRVGDNASDALAACGSPTKENETYANIPMPSANKPEIWIYKADQYHPAIRMTIVDGKLVSIE